MKLAEHSFTDADQQRFAMASGDHNPMHVDPVFARRTQAGAPVVHGIHLLLWALNALAAAQPGLPPLRKVRAQFNRFLYLNEPAEVVPLQQKASSMRLSVSVQGMSRSRFNVDFGQPDAACPDWLDSSLEHVAYSPKPLNPSLEETRGQRGRLSFQMSPAQAATMFPELTSWLGAQSVQALAASPHLVGMIYPGLHSVYSELSVSRCTGAETEFLGFRVADVDARFGTIDHEISGGGWAGIVNSAARSSPTVQPTMESLRAVIGPSEFAGSVALIIGGSRGLGELTAKMIAQGGGHVIVTWHRGSSDAERVAQEIRAAGRTCETIAYDARSPAADLLAMLSAVPTHMYYFATPAIYRPQAEPYVASRLKEFLAVYVDGFWDLVKELRSQRPDASLFYPSSVFVDERPEGMTEYAMAKAAGEALCTDMNATLAPLHITQSRLPRLPTDQTISIAEMQTADPIQTMLPIVREVQSWPR